jgi:endonuclease/exonuclease/phosphatase family metal-dependent hydrolase
MMRRWYPGFLSLCLAAATAAADVPLRIVTFNTYQGIANTWNERVASGNLLTSLDLDGEGPNTSLMPDIVCLQETTSLSDLEDFRDDYLPGYHVLKGPTTDGFYSNGFFIRGDLPVLKFDEFGTPGPRPVLRLIVGIPDATEYCLVYNAHFKAGQTGGDPDIRRAEANAIANRVAVDLAFGIDVDGDGAKEFFPTYYFFVGDLNQDDFESDVIDALLEGGSNGLPTGLNDVRVESLYGAQFPTFLGNTYSTRYSLNSRYDYILASDAIFAAFDTNADQTVDQDELNAAGFVYISGDDDGQQASGDVDATTNASDHAPVAVDFPVPGGISGDLDRDGDVDLSDLAILLSNYGMLSGANPEEGDLDGDGDVDLSDLAELLANYGIGP